jgi:hypothetical protein
VINEEVPVNCRRISQKFFSGRCRVAFYSAGDADGRRFSRARDWAVDQAFASYEFDNKDTLALTLGILATYFFSSTITVWISVLPVFSTASDSASRHHASPAFLLIGIVFPSGPVILPIAGVMA